MDQLAERFAQRIRSRLMAPGARLPSVRQCAEQHNVSPSTVVAAYDQLLAQGEMRRDALRAPHREPRPLVVDEHGDPVLDAWLLDEMTAALPTDLVERVLKTIRAEADRVRLTAGVLGAQLREVAGGFTFAVAAECAEDVRRFIGAEKPDDLTPALLHARVVLPPTGAPQTLLLIGSDHRAGESFKDANTDTMMLVRVNDKSSTINMLSIPRDIQVEQVDGRDLHLGVVRREACLGLGADQRDDLTGATAANDNAAGICSVVFIGDYGKANAKRK